MALSLHFYACDLESKFTASGARSIRSLLNRSAAFLVAAFVLWNVDNFCCSGLRELRAKIPYIGPFLQFHAWWHVLTMISGTHSIVAMTTAWCKTNPGDGNYRWHMRGRCNGMIPWLSIDQVGSKSKKKKEN